MDPKTISENESWNANTILDIEKDLPGVKIEKIDESITKIIISSEHPVAKLAVLLEKEGNVNLPGEYNDWTLDNPFKTNPETGDLENEITWDGQEIQCKVAFTNTESKWQDGKWKAGANQKLKRKL